jgi:biotin carboxyl carrier protein
MKLELELGSKIRQVEFTLDRERVRSSIDGRVVEADAVEVSPGTYSILIDGKSFEARVESSATGLRVHVDGREYLFAIRDARQWRRYRGAAAEAEGRQKVVAPMPGKVIRLLVKAGDPVESGQGLLVVEAMKMQNEVRSPKSGTVEELTVLPGQTVNAGDTLGFIV